MTYGSFYIDSMSLIMTAVFVVAVVYLPYIKYKSLIYHLCLEKLMPWQRDDKKFWHLLYLINIALAGTFRQTEQNYFLIKNFKNVNINMVVQSDIL